MSSSDELALSPPFEVPNTAVLYQFRASSGSNTRPEKSLPQSSQPVTKEKRSARAAGDVRGAHAPVKKRKLVSVSSTL